MIYNQISFFVDDSSVKESVLLKNFVNKNTTINSDLATIMMSLQSNGINIEWRQQKLKPLLLCIDVDLFAAQQKTFPSAKQGAFNQALGRQTKHIIDATGGWGGDALLMCAQGYQVTIVERHPVIALMLKDAMLRLAKTAWAKANDVSVPHVIEANAIEIISLNKLSADCIYLDPMFPVKRKKSAAVNKYMQFLQWLVGADNDADDLLKAALNSKVQRVAVKRPNYAQPLLNETVKPTDRFSSKLVHYDVYLPSQIN